MNVSEQERSIRRRLLCTAMPADSSTDVVNAALELLENEFGDKPSLRYSELVKRLRERLDESVELGGLLGKIMVLRNKPADDLLPDPMPGASQNPARVAKSVKQTRSAVASKPSAPPLPARFTVFNKLFEGVVEKVHVRGEAVADELVQFLTSQNLESVKGFTEWTRGAGTRLVGTDEELHRVINSTFVWMCGKFGPVDADRVLADAVRGAEQLPEAYEHSPRSFL